MCFYCKVEPAESVRFFWLRATALTARRKPCAADGTRWRDSNRPQGGKPGFSSRSFRAVPWSGHGRTRASCRPVHRCLGKGRENSGRSAKRSKIGSRRSFVRFCAEAGDLREQCMVGARAWNRHADRGEPVRTTTVSDAILAGRTRSAFVKSQTMTSYLIPPNRRCTLVKREDMPHASIS